MAKETSTNQWYVSGPLGIRGPMDEIELRKHLNDPQTTQVKQGFSNWYPASVIRAKLKRLDEEGIYVLRRDAIEGPYTVAKAYDVLKSATDSSIQVKTTVNGKWVPMQHWLNTLEQMRDR